MYIKILAIIIICIALLCCLSAQGLEIIHHRTDSSNADMIRTDISVINMNAESVLGLTKDDFKVKLNDSVISRYDVATYQQEARGVDILLCLDVSGSMYGSPMRAMKSALRDYVSGLRNTDRMAIMTFADEVKILCEFIGDKAQLLSYINGLQTEGNYTVQYRAGMDAITKLTENDSTRIDYLVMIGDGIDTDPNRVSDDWDVIASAQAKAIRVNTVGFYHREANYLRILESIARETGGAFCYANDEHSLNRFLDANRKEFLNTYVITTYPESQIKKGENNLFINVSKPFGVADTLITFESETGADDDQGLSRETIIYIAIAAVGVLILIIIFSMISKKNKKKKQAEMIRKQKEADKDIESHVGFNSQPPQRPSNPYAETQMGDYQMPEPIPPEPERQAQVKPDLDRTMILAGGSDKDRSSGFMIMTLRFAMGPLTGQSIKITTAGATIGRAEDNSIVVPDMRVSSRHASVTYQNGIFMIQDLDSKNGIYIDGNRVEIYRIEKNCTFKIGTSEGHIILS
ncbi:MAG: VWA domain-containing protein [Candidatus Cloacimonetes bacterium]|nr:VWA domain-containing protein [Candidatus Cloacimonadota bacterium]